MRIFLLELEIRPANEIDGNLLPHNPGKIRSGDLVADKPTGWRLRKVRVEHRTDSFNLFHVPIDGGRETFGVEGRKPDGLAVVRTLTYLKC